MADVTINNLPDLTISGTSYLVHTNNVTTGRATVNQLKTALNITPQIQSNWSQTDAASFTQKIQKLLTHLSLN